MLLTVSEFQDRVENNLEAMVSDLKNNTGTFAKKIAFTRKMSGITTQMRGINTQYEYTE
jgi:hypothetical protein